MNTEQEELLLQDIKKRLDVLISLQVAKELKENKNLTTRDMIAFLSLIGLKYTEIATILGRSPSYVASEQSVLKKKTKTVSTDDTKVTNDG